MGGTSARREAREQVLGLLYEAETKAATPLEVAAERSTQLQDYTSRAISGLGERLGEVDRLIQEHAHGWALDRMPATDRAILRLAVWELLDRTDVPAAVAITEAVELAKRYSTDDSSRFVNGVLAAVARKLGR